MASQHLDLDEQETLDKLKDFWRRYGNFITWTLIVVLGGFAAWNGYAVWQTKKAGQASALFDAFEEARQAKDATKINRVLDDLGRDYPKTTYTQQAQLLAAQYEAEQGNLDNAKKSLQSVIANAKDEGYVALARLRLAGVLADQKSYDAALEALAAEMPKSFASLVADRQGDIYTLQGKPEQAKKAYEKAYTLTDDKNPYRSLIEVKMRALGVEPPAPATTASQAKSG